jgi:hypothetical protein
METNPQAKEVPKDYTKYPGKMGHATCLAFRVGCTKTNSAQRVQLLNTLYQPMKAKARNPVNQTTFNEPNNNKSTTTDK